MPLREDRTQDHLMVARINLGHFMTEQAERARQKHGTDFVASPDAPSSYPDLLATYMECIRTGKPFPVSSAHCERTIYRAPAGNLRFRFVHDLGHVEKGLSFSLEDEIELGAYHLETLRADGYDAKSLEHRLLHADTIGQTYCQALIGRFPYDQLGFALDALNYGVDTAVERESQRLPQRQPCTR